MHQFSRGAGLSFLRVERKNHRKKETLKISKSESSQLAEGTKDSMSSIITKRILAHSLRPSRAVIPNGSRVLRYSTSNFSKPSTSNITDQKAEEKNKNETLKKDDGQLEEKELSEEEKKAQAAQLALQSIKDIGTMFSSAPDEATQPIDTKPIFEDPSLFGTLSLLHQGQVLKELQEKFDKKWHKLTVQDKKLGYYIAYGNWGVREDFRNWQTNEPPYDLPFHLPLKIKTSNPSAKTIIKKLEPVILADTPVREKQFDMKKMDGITKFFIYLTVFISILAIARDKNTGESGKPVETIIEDPYEKERQLRQEREKEAEEALKKEAEAKQKRKWYYLWLK